MNSKLACALLVAMLLTTAGRASDANPPAASAPAAEGSWPNVKYTEVKAYAWPVGDREPETLISNDFSLQPGGMNKDGAVLSKEQTAKLIAAVTGKHERVIPAKCYEPHNLFVFYDGTKPVAYLELCFTCSGKRAQPEGVAENIDYKALKAIFEELKLPTGKDEPKKE